MGNPSPTDRRFDKPSLESLVDLINRSNKTYIKYGEIVADQVTPIEGSESELWNTTVRVRLAGAGEGAPSAIMTYGRLDIGEYLPETDFFLYSGPTDFAGLLTQLKEKYHIQLSDDECTITIESPNDDGTRNVRFTPNAGHMVWTGELAVLAIPSNHISNQILDFTLGGFTLEQLVLPA